VRIIHNITGQYQPDKRWLLLFAVFWAATLHGQQFVASTDGLPTLNRVEQIRRLTREEANRGYPVRLQAVVTYYTATGPRLLPLEFYTSAQPDMFIQDSTAGIWVHVLPGGPTAVPGQLIEIEGITEEPDFGQEITRPRWEVIGQAPMPIAHRPSFDRMAATAEDAQWVEVDGIVRAVEAQSGYNLLVVAVSGGRLRAVIPGIDQSLSARLPDAEVRIRGVGGALFNQKDQLIGVLLYVPSLKELQVTKPARADPFTAAAQPLSSLQQFTPEGVSGHRIHVRGAVSLQRPGSFLYISDGTTGLRVETNQSIALRAGDIVDVLGFPHLSKLRPVLDDAMVRLFSHGPPPTPMLVPSQQLLEGEYDSALVSIEARLLEKSLVPQKQTLMLQTDGLIVNASMNAAKPDPALFSLRDGSRIRVTGICMVEKDGNGRNQSFELLFDEAGDIATIETPPWWTLQHALQALGIMMLVVVAAAAWVLVLKRRVKQASSQLQEANLNLTRLSNLDGLTGIANRRMFDQTLEIEWNRARLIGTHLSLVLVDIDHFKRLNDTVGHQMGDECLKLIAAELANAARRATDFVARFGGEEFVLILPGTDPLQAAQLAESARLAVKRLGIRYSNQSAGASVTISLGVASAFGDLFPSAESLVKAADRALYEAKHQGRNRTVSYPGSGCPDASAGLDLGSISIAQSEPTRGL
jgi:diguanylate cyclase (GGDEF)-like protein